MFNNPDCNNQAQGSALCKTNNGTLTGPANSDEYAYIQGISAASYYTSNQRNYKYLTYWIDGKSLPGKYNYSFEDPTHNGITNYKWAGAPSGSGTGYCLYNPNAKGYYIFDISCTITVCCDPICWRGALCQVATNVQVLRNTEIDA
ncbi:unnamed protein product [Caenorhabditis brenneri]